MAVENTNNLLNSIINLRSLMMRKKARGDKSAMYFFRIMMNVKNTRAKLSCFEELEQSLRKNQCYDCYQYVWNRSKIIIPDINIK